MNMVNRLKWFSVVLAPIQAMLIGSVFAAGVETSIGTFKVVIDPPIGTFYSKGIRGANGEENPKDNVATTFRDHQYARGLVFKSGQQSFVLCVLDVCTISGACYADLQNALAEAAGCNPMDVAVHVIHQHDAVRLGRQPEPWWEEARGRILKAVEDATANAETVTSVGTGVAIVKDAAGNRRILGPDGEVLDMRFAMAPAPLKVYPVGLIDPYMNTAVFFGADGKAIVSISFYATHPQTRYDLGTITADMPGEALRLMYEKYPDADHIYMTGCAGNISLGKFTALDLEKDVTTLGKRVFDGMDLAYQQALANKQPLEQVLVSAKKFDLPMKAPAPAQAGAQQPTPPPTATPEDTRMLIQTVQLNDALLLFMPSELFVEYQLFAKSRRLGHFVGVAAYGNMRFGYVGVTSTYAEGGYEANVGRVNADEIESAVKTAISEMVPAL